MQLTSTQRAAELLGAAPVCSGHAVIRLDQVAEQPGSDNRCRRHHDGT